MNETMEKFIILKDIKEREDIIKTFESTGDLDRNNAIKKVKELQITDSELQKSTIFMQTTRGAVNLNQAENEVIIENLRFQVIFLYKKLIK